MEFIYKVLCCIHDNYAGVGDEYHPSDIRGPVFDALSRHLNNNDGWDWERLVYDLDNSRFISAECLLWQGFIKLVKEGHIYSMVINDDNIGVFTLRDDEYEIRNLIGSMHPPKQDKKRIYVASYTVLHKQLRE
jgi:hypothetical protein